ncbi:patatin-like phospholipase family protein [Amycolatopsis sp. YIM 10]|uniref:patatin-like phospholipase family protein n=1 Tax=Amycolatopsis sp. YIM 10 TaxID=2653857 RepID=UPI00128FDC52|nr:patatin-like phospholipase family protein [Amycolatopsis sp. YIM 10]QFU90504.1 Patatin-like phospholipase [Amycolatopsis sp. YIM 10]
MTQRALVLGGGGITGIAWEWGMLTGLAEAGVDLTGADLVIGTSAGSVVGAQVASGVEPAVRYQAQLEPPDGELAATLGRGLMLRFALALLGPPSGERFRARVGRIALRARTEAAEADRIAVIESRLPVRDWPERRLLITAVDAVSGRFRAFDRHDGVPLVHAVAASCAVPGVWPPVTIDGRRYIDGGVRSGSNADLAAGADRVVVLAPLPRGIGPMTPVGKQVEVLRERSEVELVSPDRAALEAFGRNVLDPAARAAAARAGYAQAKSEVERVGAVWAE